MEEIFNNWKEGNINATTANAQLSALNGLGLQFANAIDNGHFQDPISMKNIINHDDILSSQLIGNAIISSYTLRLMVANVSNPYRCILGPDGDPIHEDLVENLPSIPDKEEFIIGFHDKLKNPMTNINL